MRDYTLLGLVVASIIGALLNDLPIRRDGSDIAFASVRRFSEIDLEQEHLPPYIGAVNGQAFVLKQKERGIQVIPFKTSLPVFKAFGLSKDLKTLLYTPLKNAIPSGELYVEDLMAGSARKITSHVVIEAAWSPTDVDKIAYTFAGGHGFGLAVVDLQTDQLRIIASNQVMADMLQWNDSGEGISYFQAVADHLNTHLSPQYYSFKSGAMGQLTKQDLGAGFPAIRENVILGNNDEAPSEISFRYRSPDGGYEVGGDSLLGSGPIYARKLPSASRSLLAEGKLVKVLQKGIVVRIFKDASSRLEFIDWSGRSTSLGAAASAGYNLPLKNPKVTQGGVLYPSPGNCNIVSHGPGFGYAYDLTSTTIGEHVLASADGLVVYTISTVTCNTIDTNCSDYDPNGCPGTFLGNEVVIQHSDGSYTGYGHMQKYSVQVPVGAAVCQGAYIGRQGHTGSTRGNVVPCGDHLHFQRQPSPDMLGGTLSISFSDVVSNPLSCGTTYTSGSTEFSNSISPANQSFVGLGGNGTVNVISPGGCSWLASSNDGWITITSPGTGAGNDVVTYTVSENTSGMPRAGTMTIAGQNFTVTQDGGGVTNQPPTVDAGPDQTLVFPSGASLTGTVTDDGLPNPPGAITISWTQVSGPGTVSFANSSAAVTTATFSLAGVYVLRLTASDLAFSTSDDVNITLNANQAPTINLTGPADGSSFTPPATITVSASATDSDGSISKVDFFANGALIGTDTTEPYSIDWANAQPGNYSLTAAATDNLGGVTTSSNPVVITILNGGGGALSSSGATPTSSINLSTEGSLDWAHWGLTSATSFNHKGGVTQQISNFTNIGIGNVSRVNANPVAFSWTGGTPTASATNTPSGVWRSGIGNGYQIIVPADTTDKVLRLYLGLWAAQGRLEVTLGDSSAPVYIDTSLNNSTGTSVRVYTISYRAGSSGQQLKIKWTMLTSYAPFGNITLQAATLVMGGSSANQAPVANAGPDQTVTLPASVTLNGTVTDDGLPNPPGVLSTNWTMVSGPGTVSFTNANSANTTASFSAAGVYVLRLTANDSALANSDDVTITVNAAGSTNQAPVVNAGPDQTIVLPASAALNGTVTDDGLPNPPSAVTTTWTMVSGPGTVSFFDPNAVSTTASFSAAGVYVLQLTAGDSALSSSDNITITVNDAGLLSAVSATPASAVNLTLEGVADWAHWGLTSATSFNHKSGVAQQISNYTKIGSAGVSRVGGNPVTYSWSDGTPTASATNTPSGIYVGGVNNGFQITAPANNTTKTLKLYLGLWRAQGRLEVTLGDNSAPAYIDTSLNNSTGTSVRVYTISYRAGSSGQQLKIKWTMLTSYDPFGNITLQAATLVMGGSSANQAPVANAGPDQTVTLPASVTLNGTVTDDGLPNPPGVLSTNWTMVSGPGTVSFTNANSANTTASFSAAGVYVLRLTANDSALANSDDVTITVNAAGSTNQAPVVNAGPDQTIVLPASAALNGTVTDDGLPNPPSAVTTTWTMVSGPGTVSFFDPNAVSTTASFSAAGVYVLQLTAGDSALSSSDNITITVNDAGLLSAVSATPASAVNLTLEGVADWAHWGLTSATSFNHKSGVAQQISNYTKIGSAGVSRVGGNPVTYSWSDGTPTASATNTPSGIYVGGVNNGFQITAPANNTTKTLKLYLGLWKAQGRLEVTLGDNSAPAYIDTSLNNSTGTSVRVYTISYRAGSSGQQLKIKWTMLTSYDPFGNITLQAATL